MKEFTAGQLLSAIRDSDDLDDLKRMVGVDKSNSVKSSSCIAKSGKLWESPEKYEQLNAEQIIKFKN
jgi:hypothetical protein